MIELKPIKSNFKNLDSLTGGFFPGEVTVVGARPTIGKTAFIGSLIKNIIREPGNNCLFFSIEMAAETFRKRLATSMLRIPFSKIRDSKLNQTEEESLKKQLKEINDFPLYIVDKPDQNIMDLCKQAKKIVREKDIKIIFIDYLGLIHTPVDCAPVFEQASLIIKKLKILARELNIPIVLTCQVARSGYPSTPPDLMQLRGTGDIEGVADVIILIDRETSKEICATKLIVAKNHNGKLGTAELSFIPDFVLFEE